MNVPFLDLRRQYENLREELEIAVIEVMRSGAYIGGKYVDEFEKNMKAYLGVDYVISCANGTDAIMIALRACGVGPGDEVITTPFTFFATAEAVAAIGALPVFADIGESDFNIDPCKIEEKITPKTKAILPVHIFGWPCEMDEINRIAKNNGIVVVEDAAQAVGCEYKGGKIGNSNNLVTFSFYPTKNLGAFGDAGMLATNDENLALIARALREHGMAKIGAKAKELLYGTKNEHAIEHTGDSLYNPYKYFNYLIAYNSRLDAVQAAILNVKLRRLDEYNTNRARIASIYESGLKNFVKTPMPPPNGKSCYHQYAIRTKRKVVLGEYLSGRGMGSGAFYPVPLHLQKAFDYLGYKPGDMPIAEMIASQTVCLPIFPELTDEEAEAVITAIVEFEGAQ